MQGTTRGMSALDLHKLERIARNFPIVTPLEMEYEDTPHGTVYLAYARDGNGKYHGIWGANGVAHTVEFKPEATQQDVRFVLLADAQEYCDLAAERGMFDDGWWNVR